MGRDIEWESEQYLLGRCAQCGSTQQELAQLRGGIESALKELDDIHGWINGVNIKGLVLDYRYEDRQRVMNQLRSLLKD